MFPLHHIRERIEAACARANRRTAEITLVGASKTRSLAQLEAFFAEGLRDFGENYVQEGTQKVREARAQNWDAHWHFIGALQSNKAALAVQNFELIHSVDRVSLARELDKEARKIGKIQRVLVQVNVGDEASKAGVSAQNLERLLDEIRTLSSLKIEGLMSLPPFENESQRTRKFHATLRELNEKWRVGRVLSMGMSHDFEVAIEEGATHIRVGTALFGARS